MNVPAEAQVVRQSVVDTNIHDLACVKGLPVAPRVALSERAGRQATTALERNVPVAEAWGPPITGLTFLDGREEPGSTPGGMYTWYALAALGRFHLPRTPGKRLDPGRTDLEYLALARHLHQQARLHRLYTRDKSLTKAAMALDVAVDPARAAHEPPLPPVDPAIFVRDEWSPVKWLMVETDLRCNLTGHLPLARGEQSFYSFEVLREFFSLNEGEQAATLNRRGIVRASLIDALEAIRRSSWLGENPAYEAARRLALEPAPVSVLAAPLVPLDYDVAANLIRAEADQQWFQQHKDRARECLPPADAQILAAAINRTAAAVARSRQQNGHGETAQNSPTRIRLHVAANRIGRIRQLLTGEQIEFVRGVPGTRGDLSSSPEILDAVRGLELVAGP